MIKQGMHATWLLNEVPGLNINNVWCVPRYKHIFPRHSLPKRDRDALKAAGYRWDGRWWARQFTDAECE